MELALVLFVDDLWRTQVGDTVMVLALLDFLAAFNTTNYDIISDQLKDLGVGDMVLVGLFSQQL